MNKKAIILMVILCFLLISFPSAFCSGIDFLKNQENNIVYGNEFNHPRVGLISIVWREPILGRPHVTVGYPENRNYSFPIINGSVQLGFNVLCYISTEEIFLPIPHYSFFSGQIRDNEGNLRGKTSGWTTIRNKGDMEFNLTIHSQSYPADVITSDNFTVKIIGIGYPPQLKINWISYPIWVSYFN